MNSVNFKNNKIVKICRENVLICGLIVFFILGGIRYVNLSARNVVFMDFWRNICKFIEPVMEGEWPWREFWEAQFGQRNFLQMFLLAIDIKYLNLNCIWESYAGIIVIACTSIIIWLEWKRVISFQLTNKRNKLIHTILFFPLLLCLFNLNQWEILSLQFSFAFMFRIFCYVLIMFFTNSLLQNNDANLYKYCILGFFSAIVIDFLSQLYWPALVITLIITWIIDLLKKKQYNFKIVLAYWIPIFTAIFIYMYRLNDLGAGGNLGILIELLKSGGFILAILYMLAGCVTPQSVLQGLTNANIITIGVIIAVIVVIAIFMFFKKHMEDRTYFPMMLCAYGLLSIVIIIYGRVGSFDLMYLTSSRYTCETSLILVGIALTYCMCFFVNRGKYQTLPLLIILIVFIGYADYTEFNIAPNRGLYKDNLVEMMSDINYYEDNELAVFQSDSQLVRTGITLMKKYKLNIFYDKYIEEIGNTLETAANKENIWEDRWVGKDASLRVSVGDEGYIYISTYNPFYVKHLDGRCEVLVDGECRGIIDLSEENSSIKIETQPNTIAKVKFVTNYYEDEQTPGERQLCFVISMLESK